MKKLLLLALFFPVVGCVDQTAGTPVKVTQSQKAAAAANTINFTENAEIDQIKSRLELTSSPSLLGYVVLMNEAGQPVLYTSVKGKLTSGGKRLTPPVQSWNHWKDGVSGMGKGGSESGALGPAPSDEGTWGSSSPYVYFWDTNGAYHQWNGKYLYSDNPIRLSVKPLVISVGDVL